MPRDISIKTADEIHGKEFTCLVNKRRFTRTDEYRHPRYREYYELYPGACITDKAQLCHHAFKGWVVSPKYPGKPN